MIRKISTCESHRSKPHDQPSPHFRLIAVRSLVRNRKITCVQCWTPPVSCVARLTRQVSVSEFISLVKVLTATKNISSGTKGADGFNRKQAYMLLRCVDHDGDRTVALRDLVVFVFATWTEELSRLRSAEALTTTGSNNGAGDPRQKRRQLQKVHLFSEIDLRVGLLFRRLPPIRRGRRRDRENPP